MVRCVGSPYRRIDRRTTSGERVSTNMVGPMLESPSASREPLCAQYLRNNLVSVPCSDHSLALRPSSWIDRIPSCNSSSSSSNMAGISCSDVHMASRSVSIVGKGHVLLKKSASSEPDNPVRSKRKCTTLSQSRLESRIALGGGQCESEDGPKWDFSAGYFLPTSHMRPPAEYPFTPMPEVPPRESSRAMLRGESAWPDSREAARPTASKSDVFDPRPACAGIDETMRMPSCREMPEGSFANTC